MLLLTMPSAGPAPGLNPGGARLSTVRAIVCTLKSTCQHGCKALSMPSLAGWGGCGGSGWPMRNRGARGKPKLQGSHKFSHKMPMVRAYCSSPQTAFAQGHHTYKCKEVCQGWQWLQHLGQSSSIASKLHMMIAAPTIEVQIAVCLQMQSVILQMTSKKLNSTAALWPPALSQCTTQVITDPGYTTYGFQGSPAPWWAQRPRAPSYLRRL